jgi:hypothetical protein
VTFKLLLADDDTRAPVLGTLAEASLARAPQPERREPSHLSLPGHSDDLQAEQWGVIVPDTVDGTTLLDWIRPLLALRSQQCGLHSDDKLCVFKVAPGMTRPQARSWRAEHERRHPAERPGYLLIAGDLDDVSLELQQELAVCASVGRLCFKTLDGDRHDRAGYEAYCEKLVGIETERARWDDDPRMLFYASHDGSDATATGYHELIQRAYADARADRDLRLAGAQLFGSAEDHAWYAPGREPEVQASTLLHAAAAPHPAVLLSLTHGAGVTDRGRQRLRQGALVLQEMAGEQRTEVIDHEFFRQTFLPRGFWFLKACFGAGTPATSVYTHWLAALAETGDDRGDPRAALRYLAADAPFVARVPQVALARRDGPLGILAHVDLAWTFGLEALDEATPAMIRGEHGPYYDVLRMVAAGHRFGPAVAGLTDKAQALGSYLALLYGDAEITGTTDNRERLRRRAWTWMRYLDLAGYILLGDPAAQIPIRAARDLPGPVPPNVVQDPAPPSLEDRERAVLAYLQQRKPPDQIATEAGVHVTTLERWVRTYKDAGRRALAELGPGPDGARRR